MSRPLGSVAVGPGGRASTPESRPSSPGSPKRGAPRHCRDHPPPLPPFLLVLPPPPLHRGPPPSFSSSSSIFSFLLSFHIFLLPLDFPSFLFLLIFHFPSPPRPPPAPPRKAVTTEDIPPDFRRSDWLPCRIHVHKVILSRDGFLSRRLGLCRRSNTHTHTHRRVCGRSQESGGLVSCVNLRARTTARTVRVSRGHMKA